MKFLTLLLLPIFLGAQNVGIGSWKDYLCYSSASHIAESERNIYCVASGSLFFIEKTENTITRLSKINGLSDFDIKKIGYSYSLEALIITYENCNIDILKENNIINISDIKRKDFSGAKRINNITINDDVAYLSTSLGLILLDIKRNEIKDSYVLADSTGSYEITGCTFWGDSIIVTTSAGVFYANKASQNLSDNNNWHAIQTPLAETYDNIVFANDSLYGDYSHETTSISYNNSLIKTKAKKIIITNKNGIETELTHEKLENIKYAWMDNEEVLWVADSINGLLQFTNFEFQEEIVPEGPVRNDLYSLEYEGGMLYMCHGGHSNFATNSLINDGVSIKNSLDDWKNYDRYDLGNARDILSVAVQNNLEYYASWYHGIPEMKNGVLSSKYGFANTNGVLDTCWYSNNRIRISDLKFDSEGNLWALSSEVNNPIVVKTKNNTWHAYSMNQNQVGLFFDDLLIDSYNQKWGVLARGEGLFVFNDNHTIENPYDDEYKILNTNIGQGRLPSMQTYSLEEDLNGSVWVGTDRGVCVFYNPEAVFSGYNFDCEQILITEGEYGQYLLSEEKVKCIAIDGANRKWVGTEKSGVFLLSENGEDEILHFTEKNSPLLSNNVIDIAIDHQSGEVFIGTSKGLISYRSNATKGRTFQENTSVFPNPVKEDYTGDIAISGLVSNANIKITDISGELVFETTANGGTAIWDGKNRSGNRASTGVYLVFSVDFSGKEKIVSKILFIK